MEQEQQAPRGTTDAAEGTFSHELQVRLVEARASLAAAEALEDDLSAQIAAGDLADLQALASRNDLPTEPAD